MGAACSCAASEEEEERSATSDTQVLLSSAGRQRRPWRALFGGPSARVHPSSEGSSSGEGGSSGGAGGPSHPVVLEPPTAAVVSFTHEGGAGGLGKENQDVSFTAQLSADVLVCAVFDGHGKRHGRVAARAAAAATEQYLRLHLAELIREPEQTLRRASEDAHGAVRKALLAADPSLRSVGEGSAAYLLEWMEIDEDDVEEGGPTHRWDAADGGTTATVAVIFERRTLVVAAVGDGSALLFGLDGGGAPAHELLLADHGPTNAAEYERISAMISALHPPPLHVTGGPRFVYDCTEAETFDEIGIFCVGADGGAVLDEAAQARADAADVPLKSSRGDRCTLVWIPETAGLPLPEAAELGGAAGAAQSATIEEQAMTMTRSLGDFYAHSWGVSCEAEVRSVDLDALVGERGWRAPRLLLASDGVWDLYEYAELARRVCGGDDADLLQALGAAVCEETRARGAEYFDEAADNLTGVLVALDRLGAEAEPPPASLELQAGTGIKSKV